MKSLSLLKSKKNKCSIWENLSSYIYLHVGFRDGSAVKNQDLQCRRLGFNPWAGKKDLLEEEMATHSSIPAWRIPWREEPGGLQSTD